MMSTRQGGPNEKNHRNTRYNFSTKITWKVTFNKFGTKNEQTEPHELLQYGCEKCNKFYTSSHNHDKSKCSFQTSTRFLQR